MPLHIDPHFKMEFSNIEIPEETRNQLRELFIKLLPLDALGDDQQNMDLKYMKHQFEKLNFKENDPKFWSMICWMTESYTNSDKFKNGMSFDDWLTHAVYFFSQRHHDEGLKYIYQLFDLDHSNGIDIDEFEKLCKKNGFNMSQPTLERFFYRASGNDQDIEGDDFSKVMRRENYH